MPIYIGCAGWSLPREQAAEFAGDGTHLARYAQRLNTVEINSSFYRSHQRKTYARWGATVPAGFRFSVKMPKVITHECRLQGARSHLDRFLEEISGLGERLGALLVQFPPSLNYEAAVAEPFFQDLRRRLAIPIVCEPRHRSWFTPQAGRLFENADVARAIIDPAPVPAAAELDGWSEFRYLRLHGSPRIYYSSYDFSYLQQLAERMVRLAAAGQIVWCIFDNTAAGSAIQNALTVQQQIASMPQAQV